MSSLKNLVLLVIIITSCGTSPKGSGKSIAKGKVNNGELINGRRFPYKGENYKYFSPLSFTCFNRAWVHSKVIEATLAAYKTCDSTCPNTTFLLMECSKKHGGRMRPHRTHQNGTSIDFGTPMLRNGKPYNFHHSFGVFHYAMKFDDNGISAINKNISIDFETMGKHILALDNAARKHGLYVKKVIFKIDLKDNLYQTKSGQEVKKRKIYFAKKLSKTIDIVHDDHYHVDFGFLK